jgi:hypothetical protein
LEIQELKRDLEIFFTDSENGYGLYSTERLLILAQQGDEKAKLQILFNFKGLIYKTLVNNSYYLQLSAGDILQNLSEVVLQRMEAEGCGRIRQSYQILPADSSME